MKSRKISLLWKWSLRDIRERWMQVVGISLIIALGVALFSGLSSTVPWRTKSFKKSYDVLNMYDLKLELTPGSYLDAEQLAHTVRSIPHADWIKDMEVRLTFFTPVDASTMENLIVGILGTALGIALGWLLLNTSIMALFEHDAPELNAVLSVYPATYGWAVLIGVIVVALTPVFLTRRLVKMDIPSTLRVIE